MSLKNQKMKGKKAVDLIYMNAFYLSIRKIIEIYNLIL